MARLIAALVLSILLLVFIIQNSHDVALSFLFWQFNGSLALILLLTVLTTLIVIFLISLPFVVRKKFFKKEVKKVEETPIKTTT